MTCPQGHQWEARSDPTLPAPQDVGRCPLCGAAGRAVTEPADAWPTFGDELPPLPQPATPSTAELSRGSWPAVSGYEILGELGRGGMGIVYRARQQSLGRLVALKMLLPGAAGPEELARFRREAEAIAALRHANFVHIYDVGEQECRPFCVLEFVDGGSLAQRLAGRPLPPGEAAQLVATLARAVHCAHQLGIVHRDLKPTNILLMADGTPKIADFGLAKMLHGPGGNTFSGAILGTPGYLAPEQAQGRSGTVGPAADVYALGVILYETLTGRPPFRADTVLEILNQVVHEPPVPPSRVQPNVPPELERICLRCLHKEPARRYASAADLAEDLHCFLGERPSREGTSVLPRPTTPRNSPWRWTWVAVACVLLAFGVGGLVWRLWPAADAPPDPPGTTAAALATTPGRKVEPTPEVVKLEPVVLRWGGGKVACLAFAPDGKTVALGGESTTVQLRDVRTGDLRAEFKGHPGHVFALAFSPGGETLSVGLDKQVWLWEVSTRKKRDVLEGHTGNVVGLAYCLDGKTLVTVGARETIVTPPKPGKEPAVLQGSDWNLLADGKTLARCAFALMGSKLILWDIAEAEQREPIGLGLTKLLGNLVVAGSGDGRTVVVGQDNQVRLWEALTGGDLGSHGLHEGRITSLALTPDGKIVASGSEDRTAILWDVAGKKARSTLHGHTGPVLVRMAPDGRTLATGSAADTWVKLWDVATGLERAVLEGHGTGVVDLRFSPDGRTLAVVGPKEARLWPVPANA
jgi:hypothetical protein